MRAPTIQEIESTIKSYGIQIVTGALASFGVIFREKLIVIVSNIPKEALAATVVWLSISVFCLTILSGIYIFKSKSLERVILKIEPDFYQSRKFNAALEEALKDK